MFFLRLALVTTGTSYDLESHRTKIREEQCLSAAFPKTRKDLPAFLNCLGLVNEGVEVGVQAGVHAAAFLKIWDGRRLNLVDMWDSRVESDASSAVTREKMSAQFYVDIANINGSAIRDLHRSNCEARLAADISRGRARIVKSESTTAAAKVKDGSLDFVYLDARHDFMGVVADIQAWWPKVKIGGVFAGHDFVDGEFPEGDFFWLSAIREVLPGLEGRTHRTAEQNQYPSFFLLKTADLAALHPRTFPAEAFARRLYFEQSRYFALWRNSSTPFPVSCLDKCRKNCDERIKRFQPTRTTGWTLRPFSCMDSEHTGGGEGAAAVCTNEMNLDVEAYYNVCVERCAVTCKQRNELFAALGSPDILE
jgi:hypothetical protein